MKNKTFILIVLALAFPAMAWEDPNDNFYDIPEPPWADPNGFGNGIILPANYDPNGVADFNVPCGKLERVGTYFDGQNNDVKVDVNTPGWTITLDRVARTWKLTGEVVPGPQYVIFTVKDVPLYNDPIEKIYAIWIWGIKPENTGPVFR